MPTKTRRRLILAALLVALTLPAEWILLKAMSTDTATESVQWVSSLSESSLLLAADTLEDYPFEYRRDIMRRLDTRGRIAAWTGVIARYRDAHPELAPEQIDILNTAIQAVHVTLRDPGPKAAELARLVGTRAEELLGKDVARELLHQAGPLRVRLYSASLPWQLRATDFVRTRLVVHAEEGACNCNVGFGCPGTQTCAAGAGLCRVDTGWPACGWLWLEDCDGSCIRDDQSGIN